MQVHDLNAIAFPKLDEEQIAKLGRYAGAVAALDVEAAAVPVGNEPAGCVRRWRCAFRSVKRVASAVGEGSMSVQFVHEYLKAM